MSDYLKQSLNRPNQRSTKPGEATPHLVEEVLDFLKEVEHQLLIALGDEILKPLTRIY